MTAVASPPSISHLPRPTWSNSNGSHASMSSSEEASRMLVPRKSAQRQTSSASISSTSSASSTSTTSTTSSAQTVLVNGDTGWAATKKKPARSLWPSSKSEPVAGISTARPHSIPAASLGQSAATAISALHTPAPLLGPQQMSQSQSQLNGAVRPPSQAESAAILHLLPVNGTFERKTITLPFTPEVLRVGRQTNQKTLPTASNGYFDSKVLSRQHAEIWAERDGKVWIKDVKSSNGTFINGKRLSQENRESEPHQLKEQDVLELGIDIVSEDQKTVVHHKVAARVEHAGIYGPGSGALDLNFGELDPSAGGQVQGSGIALRGRPPSHGPTMANGRIIQNGGPNSMAAAAFHPKWLQPITMEQVVKRLNNELRQARLQTQDLHFTSNFVEAALSTEMTQPPVLGDNKPQSPSKGSDMVRSRFASEPPAPPPSQPLPEAPPSEEVHQNKASDNAALQPILKRSDTEKPKLASPGAASPNTSPTKTDATHQILSLIEALTSAKEEITSQSERLKEMEDALVKEREERKSVEEKIVKLETGILSSSPKPSAVETDVESDPTSTLEEKRDLPDPSELQQRIDVMRSEMENMKMQMEKYRQRATKAEEESQRDRKSLSEMVESLRKREEAIRRRQEKRRIQESADGAQEYQATELFEIDNINAEILDEELGDEARHPKDVPNPNAGKEVQGVQDGPSITPSSALEMQKLGKAVLDGMSTQTPPTGIVTRSQRHEQLAQTAPYASLIGVVLLGVGMMAYLNGWQKITERAMN